MSERAQARWEATSQLPFSPTLADVLLAEARGLIAALAAPQALVREVEAMGALLAEAQRVEARDPAGAQALRERAARRCT